VRVVEPAPEPVEMPALKPAVGAEAPTWDLDAVLERRRAVGD
jgi:hypothetical protein